MSDGLGFAIEEIYFRHDPGGRHPESPRRLEAVRQALEERHAGGRWQRIEARPARAEELELVHHSHLIDQVERASHLAPIHLDGDTVCSKDSYRAALFAVGGTLECVDAICTGRLRRAFAFVRPPGHHAEADRAMGFCLLNNVAIAAAYARLEHKAARVAVVDIDVHHGNGTQACFYDNPQVLFISSHQFPFYPGTGASHEVGVREGLGYTLNFPLPAGTSDEGYAPIYSRLVARVLDQYRPQLILVSAGFDTHRDDPLGGLDLSTRAIASSAASLIRAAERNCGGRICFVLEGGYSMAAMTDCTRAVLDAMEASDPPELPVDDNPYFDRIAQQARRSFGHFWRLTGEG
jgi:acetoin utilization deacetylase AcuC-like enzyme